MLHLLDPRDPTAPFPDVSLAEREPDGLLAIGGDLDPRRLLNAYRHGIFPWFSAGDPILWWSPDPRTVLLPNRVHISRSLAKTLRRGHFQITLDQAFHQVIGACAGLRRHGNGTWLVPMMIRAYQRLHRAGWAHSVEVWQDGDLVGGLYGVSLGRVFFGESMFSLVSDASKVALVHLCRTLEDRGYGLIDCQMATDHLLSLGALQIPRAAFTATLELLCADPGTPELWNPKATATGGADALTRSSVPSDQDGAGS
ncbi:MAG: leucyl/phenylalanyl-tRNA--protein transferase [Chromatiaceae bacterium]|jgi:leucyl/phenylalanyl-tRNA--protein transferase|nr:leucyl/phenylalanyl-tRNA--protein transferase [Chromatiaceae bacterium]MBP8197013.1 leucyl/phenylalanyl-tRNA--protein transferase [Chromatiaceae bacterium]